MIFNDIPEMTNDEQYNVRVFIAIAHEDGKCHIYGDDGELQCNNWQRHGRTIDFRREKMSDILDTIAFTRLKEYAESQKANT